MEDIVKTPSFQNFLSVNDPNRDKSWDEVKERVTKYCQEKNKKDEKFLKLRLGLAKYDYIEHHLIRNYFLFFFEFKLIFVIL